jgi:hypothetical protein
MLAAADRAVDRAVATDSSGLRQEHWAEADTLFAQVIANAPTENERRQYSIRASNKYVSVANVLIGRGDNERAREALRRAKGFAGVDAQLMQDIDRALEQLGG